MRALALLAALVAALFAGTAVACTMIIPLPKEGETFEQAMAEMYRKEQAMLIGQSDAVFLASSRFDPRIGQSRLSTVKGLIGRRPPSRMRIKDGLPDCGGSPTRPSGNVVVFAQQIGWREDFWRPWRWGRWVAIGWRDRDQIAEPRLLSALSEDRA